MDDAALVALARDGDSTAIGTLLGRYQSAAYTAALRLLSEPADAEDVAQEALVRAYTRLGDLGDDANFGAWVRRISVNLSLNLLRRRGAIRFEPLERNDSPAGALDRDPHFVDTSRATPEEAALEHALRDEVEALIAQLPADQRVAVVLRDMYDYDVAQIAALQRCGLSAAKMRITRGRAHLRRLWLASRAALAETPA